MAGNINPRKGIRGQYSVVLSGRVAEPATGVRYDLMEKRCLFSFSLSSCCCASSFSPHLSSGVLELALKFSVIKL